MDISLKETLREILKNVGYYFDDNDVEKIKQGDLDQAIKAKLMKMAKEIEKEGETLNEELCAKGKAYIKKRKAAGEKSSAYLSGRAVKVCKGQMKG